MILSGAFFPLAGEFKISALSLPVLFFVLILDRKTSRTSAREMTYPEIAGGLPPGEGVSQHACVYSPDSR